MDIAFGKYVWAVLEALDAKLQNINFPLDEDQKLRDLEKCFVSISKGVFRMNVAVYESTKQR